MFYSNRIYNYYGQQRKGDRFVNRKLCIGRAFSVLFVSIFLVLSSNVHAFAGTSSVICENKPIDANVVNVSGVTYVQLRPFIEQQGGTVVFEKSAGDVIFTFKGDNYRVPVNSASVRFLADSCYVNLQDFVEQTDGEMTVLGNQTTIVYPDYNAMFAQKFPELNAALVKYADYSGDVSLNAVMQVNKVPFMSIKANGVVNNASEYADESCTLASETAADKVDFRVVCSKGAYWVYSGGYWEKDTSIGATVGNLMNYNDIAWKKILLKYTPVIEKNGSVTKFRFENLDISDVLLDRLLNSNSDFTALLNQNTLKAKSMMEYDVENGNITLMNINIDTDVSDLAGQSADKSSNVSMTVNCALSQPHAVEVVLPDTKN